MKVELENVKPMDIEKRSFEIITEELGDTPLIPGTELVVKRCIHTSADFDYAKNLCFSENAVEKAIQAIKDGACIVTDTQMAKAGINKRALARYGGEVYCFMSDEDVAKIAKENGSTRATASMDKAAGLDKKLIFAIGNAPTALVRLYELIEDKKLDPELIIGVPVGFVNVVQSKELIMHTEVPYIVARGRKGGSNIAACICNALLYMIDNNRGSKNGVYSVCGKWQSIRCGICMRRARRLLAPSTSIRLLSEWMLAITPGWVLSSMFPFEMTPTLCWTNATPILRS